MNKDELDELTSVAQEGAGTGIFRASTVRKLLAEIDRLHAILKRLAYDAGYSDALFDGIETETDCQCEECGKEYRRGWDDGESKLANEMDGDE